MSTHVPDLFEVIFGMPPSTPTIPVSPSERADFATGIADRHRDMFNALREVGADNGGGMTGIAKGLLPEYVRRSMITERDRDRLYEVFDLLANAETVPEQLGRLVEVNDEIANDPESSEIALAVGAVALDSVTHSVDSAEHVATRVAATAGADTAGLLFGSFLGLAGGIAASVAASLAAEHAATS